MKQGDRIEVYGGIVASELPSVFNDFLDAVKRYDTAPDSTEQRAALAEVTDLAQRYQQEARETEHEGPQQEKDLKSFLDGWAKRGGPTIALNWGEPTIVLH